MEIPNPQLEIVCWKWGTKYGPEYVNCMASMLERNLDLPYRLNCITDDSRGLRDDVRVVTYPMNGLARARRLQLFDQSLYQYIGKRILQLDLDCVITGDITTLVDRPEPFVIWESVHSTRWVMGARHPDWKGGALIENNRPASNPFNASMFLMDAGILPNLWPDYLADPGHIETLARKAGHWTALVKDGTAQLLDAGDDDQAVLTLYAKKLNPPTWGEQDGIYKYKRIKPGLPADARMVFFQGRDIAELAVKSPWILSHWK